MFGITTWELVFSVVSLAIGWYVRGGSSLPPELQALITLLTQRKEAQKGATLLAELNKHLPSTVAAGTNQDPLATLVAALQAVQEKKA